MNYLLPLFSLLPVFAIGQCLQGVDLSYVNAIEAAGGVYRDTAGVRVDPYEYFARRGADLARLRLWHTPGNTASACGEPITTGRLTDVLAAARGASSAGMALNLAVHYSDYFVDPGKQQRPLAWAGLTGQALQDSIYQYTYRVLEALHAQGTDPAILAVGNETTNGFVDEGKRTNGFEWATDAGKFNAGLRAVRDFNTAAGATVKTAIHLTESYAPYGLREFTEAGVTDFDVIGLSYYPNYSPRVSVADLGALIHELQTQSGKEVMIFETGFSHDNVDGADDYANFIGDNGEVVGHPATPAGQRDFLLELNREVCAAGGTAVIYWEPAWISSGLCDAWGEGSSYENASWFDYDGYALPAFDFLEADATVAVPAYGQVAVRSSVFPNPVTDNRLHVKSERPVKNWRLLDMSGREVARGNQPGRGTLFAVDTERCPRGIHFLQLETDAGRAVHRVILQ